MTSPQRTVVAKLVVGTQGGLRLVADTVQPVVSSVSKNAEVLSSSGPNGNVMIYQGLPPSQKISTQIVANLPAQRFPPHSTNRPLVSDSVQPSASVLSAEQIKALATALIQVKNNPVVTTTLQNGSNFAVGTSECPVVSSVPVTGLLFPDLCNSVAAASGTLNALPCAPISRNGDENLITSPPEFFSVSPAMTSSSVSSLQNDTKKTKEVRGKYKNVKGNAKLKVKFSVTKSQKKALKSTHNPNMTRRKGSQSAPAENKQIMPETETETGDKANAETDSGLSIKIDSIFSLAAPRKMPGKSKLCKTEHSGTKSRSTKSFHEDGICLKQCFIVLERMSRESMPIHISGDHYKHTSSKIGKMRHCHPRIAKWHSSVRELSERAPCSRHCRERHLESICKKGLLNCQKVKILQTSSSPSRECSPYKKKLNAWLKNHKEKPFKNAKAVSEQRQPPIKIKCYFSKATHPEHEKYTTVVNSATPVSTQPVMYLNTLPGDGSYATSLLETKLPIRQSGQPLSNSHIAEAVGNSVAKGNVSGPSNSCPQVVQTSAGKKNVFSSSCSSSFYNVPLGVNSIPLASLSNTHKYPSYPSRTSSLRQSDFNVPVSNIPTVRCTSQVPLSSAKIHATKSPTINFITPPQISSLPVSQTLKFHNETPPQILGKPPQTQILGKQQMSLFSQKPSQVKLVGQPQILQKPQPFSLVSDKSPQVQLVGQQQIVWKPQTSPLVREKPPRLVGQPQTLSLINGKLPHILGKPCTVSSTIGKLEKVVDSVASQALAFAAATATHQTQALDLQLGNSSLPLTSVSQLNEPRIVSIAEAPQAVVLSNSAKTDVQENALQNSKSPLPVEHSILRPPNLHSNNQLSSEKQAKENTNVYLMSGSVCQFQGKPHLLIHIGDKYFLVPSVPQTVSVSSDQKKADVSAHNVIPQSKAALGNVNCHKRKNDSIDERSPLRCPEISKILSKECKISAKCTPSSEEENERIRLPPSMQIKREPVTDFDDNSCPPKMKVQFKKEPMDLGTESPPKTFEHLSDQFPKTAASSVPSVIVPSTNEIHGASSRSSVSFTVSAPLHNQTSCHLSSGASNQLRTTAPSGAASASGPSGKSPVSFTASTPVLNQTNCNLPSATTFAPFTLLKTVDIQKSINNTIHLQRVERLKAVLKEKEELLESIRRTKEISESIF